MMVIHYTHAFKALDRFIDQFNAQTKKTCQRLRTGAVLTARELIRIYGVSLLNTDSRLRITGDNLPTLRTNNQQLAKLVKCSARSIQRYILKLQEAGIIVHKFFHGTRANYELLINPKILLVNPGIAAKKNEYLHKANPKGGCQNGFMARDLANKATNCPLSYSGNTGKHTNNILIPVDKSIQRSQLPFWMTSDATGNAGEVVSIKSGTTVNKIISRPAPPGQIHIARDSARENLRGLYAGLLWLMARRLLYHSTDLTQRQVEIGRQLIDKLYEPVPSGKLSEMHSQFVARIALVDRYLRKDPKRFVTLPYLYFDIKNPNGFAGTEKWYQADKQRKLEMMRELNLNRAIRHYLQNEKKETARRQPPLQLFLQYERRLARWHDPALLKRFYKAVLDHEKQTGCRSVLFLQEHVQSPD